MVRLGEEKYRSVNLPIALMEEIDRLIYVFEDHGYTSRADFIKQAIREKVTELQALESKTTRSQLRTRVSK